MSVAGIPFELVDVKLAAPLTRPGTVGRADVIGRLRSARVPLASIVAPAGYGKTTLLAQWAEADPRPFAWVALDGRDGSAVELLRYVAAAIHRVEPVPPEVFDALSGPGASAWTKCVPRVGGALAALELPLVLALDDLHTVANASCLDALAELVQYVPAGSQIAITSREEPALPLARWRTQGRVYEVGVPELRLDEPQAELLLEAAGVALDADEVSQLTERTEGWPAGLYLAALSMQAGAASPGGVARFDGDDRFVSDYFRLELLSRLSADEARTLTHTSILHRMCGGLCDAVLQTTGSAKMLETLERANRFLVSLDRRCEWYRYHHLFGQLLRNELERSEPEVVPALNARAMAWCIANDLPEEAIAYGQAAGETSTVARLLDDLALPLYNDGRMETLEEWLGWFDDEELARYPALAVYGAWIRVLTGRPEDAERLLALADGATSAIPLTDGSATIEPWVACLRAYMMPTGVERALADASQALDQLPPGSGWIPGTLFMRGVAHALLGAFDPAREDFMTVVEQAPAFGPAEEVFLAQAMLALLAARRGSWEEAGERARAAHAYVDEHGLDGYATSSIAYVATARVAHHESNPEGARAALARAHRLRPLLDHGMPWLTVEVGLELTRVHLALGEPGPARTILTETERVLRLRPDMGFLVDDARELRERVDATSGAAGAWAMSLTGAELRLLPYLATHLTFAEIATRLFISRNTVKTEAIAIYRKLGASSRSQAIERAVEVGLLESGLFPPRVNLIPEA